MPDLRNVGPMDGVQAVLIDIDGVLTVSWEPGSLRLAGPRELVRRFPRWWLRLSVLADVERPVR